MADFEPEEGEEWSKTRPMLRERVYHPKETVSRKKGGESIILYREVSMFQERGDNVVKTNTSSRKRRIDRPPLAFMPWSSG